MYVHCTYMYTHIHTYLHTNIHTFIYIHNACTLTDDKDNDEKGKGGK